VGVVIGRKARAAFGRSVRRPTVHAHPASTPSRFIATPKTARARTTYARICPEGVRSIVSMGWFARSGGTGDVHWMPCSRVPRAHRRSWVARPGARMEKLVCRCCVFARERLTSVRTGDALHP